MTQPSFALHQLGWSDFQALCHTVTREILGQTVVAYLDNDDGGRDGAFTGTWRPTALETYSGEFVVQAKHTSVPDSTLGPADFEEEFTKAERLAAAGRCDVYLLMTNARLTARTEEKLADDLNGRGITQFRILGSTWINQTIRESSRLRMLVPRLYGLGDLTEILDERAYQQARAVLDSMKTDLAKLVRTSTYEKAAAALDDFGFVLLAGAPATGKTTIAGELSLAAADAFDTQVVALEDAGQLSDRWNPNEKQLFWLDDAFGATQFNPYLASSWQRATPKIRAAIDGGSKFVLTTRDYILRSAWSHLKPGAFPLLDGARVIVDVTDLTPGERRQILYNHLKHGRQPTSLVEQFVPHLEAIADHSGFTPELARRLADPAFTAGLGYPSRRNLETFFDKPRQFLADTFEGLHVDATAALGLIFLNRGWLPSPIALADNHKDLLNRLGGDLAGVTRSLDELDGSLVANVVREGRSGWVFAHPTMIDAYADRLRSPELLHLLVEGFSVEVLLSQTTCGDTGYGNAIVVPPQLWPKVMDRLDEPFVKGSEGWRQRDRQRSYIANQCVPKFQVAYLNRDPEFLDGLAEPGLMLEADSDNDIVTSLFASGVLPERIRTTFVGHLIDFCLNGTDGAVLWRKAFRDMLTEDEDRMLRQRLRDEIIPNPTRILDGFVEGVFLGGDDPDSFSQPVDEFADALESEFQDDDEVRQAADQLRDARREWIDNHAPPDKREIDRTAFRAAAPDAPASNEKRSVFDDLVTDQS